MAFFELSVLFAAGLVGGAFGTLVGAGTMLTMPIMIFLGIPIYEVIAVNRFGVMGLTLSGYFKFRKKKLINHKISMLLAVFLTIGAFFGSRAVLGVEEMLLEKILGIAMVVILLVIVLNKNVGLKNIDSIRKGKRHYLIGALMSIVIGFYLGFLGLGAGIFLIYMNIFVFSQTFLQSAGNIKLPGFVSSLIAAIVFLLNGKIIWSYAIILFISMSIGSYVGAHYSDKIGNVWIRRLSMGIVGIMALRLLF